MYGNQTVFFVVTTEKKKECVGVYTTEKMADEAIEQMSQEKGFSKGDFVKTKRIVNATYDLSKIA